MTLPLHDLSVSVLGQGRVGTSMAASLRAVGAVVRLDSGRGQLDTADADLILIAVADAALAEVIDRVSPVPGQVIAHTSGRHGLAVLAPVRRFGAHALAFHPAMPFSGRPVDLQGATVGLTADADALPLAERLCAALGTRPVWIAEDQRDLYHAALCHGANHLVTLVADSLRMLKSAGIADPAGMLAPLLRAALDGALERGDAATTGPVVRGDIETVSAHVAAIDRADPSITASYRTMAAETARLAVLRGVLSSTQAAALSQEVTA